MVCAWPIYERAEHTAGSAILVLGLLGIAAIRSRAYGGVVHGSLAGGEGQREAGDDNGNDGGRGAPVGERAQGGGGSVRHGIHIRVEFAAMQF